MFVGLGFLIEYCVGPYVSYTTLAVISACAALAFAVPFFLMPESPHYLIAKTRRKEAVEALRWLRGNVPPHAVEREISSIEATSKKPTGHLGGCLELVTRRGPCRALLLCLYLMFCQQLSGINAIISFSQPIFLAAHMSLSSSISPMLVGAVNCISSCFTPPLVRRFGIKNTLIGSGVGMGLCNILLSVYFYLLNSNQNVDSISVLPVICLMAYNIFFCLGIGPLPWTVAAEMFPVHLKGLANSVIGAFAWLLAFGVMRSYNSAVLALGSFGIFLLYGLLLIVGMVGTFFMLPDTRGLSLQDIQDLMDGRKSQELSSVDNFGYF
ncbi:hypothetical protein AAG570_009363 [Ranatra chinensis]|uniref:Major facilitator superfamily (MFS) profile domain-containing protein n=1 Tax=Ranatra chinensis TaxID=642074 RepID=A0ABD0YZR8_9HEMI